MMKLKRWIACLIVCVMMLSLAACGSNGEEGSVSGDSQTDSGLNGKITLAGSTSMEKLVTAMAEEFMKENSGVTVQGEYTGSGAGIEGVLNGQCDIGDSSRNLKEEEIQKGAVENIVAIDGIAVVVDNSNTVEDLTKEQLAKIYKGEITKWSEVGGSNMPIVVVGREDGSGTRDAFEELLEVEDACSYANTLDTTGAVMAKVATTPGAIGYVSLDVLDDTVKAVKLEGVEATEDNIVAGNYFLSRPFVMATKGQISQQSELVQKFFEFVYSDKGTEVVRSVGLIPAEQ